MRPIARTGIRGIAQATIPVSDLARSARFYHDLLGLRYVREFGDGTTVTGCALLTSMHVSSSHCGGVTGWPGVRQT
jgi:catechol 2,3-dioxygenase-like lactoylglutathione lyase family enzyme